MLTMNVLHLILTSCSVSTIVDERNPNHLPTKHLRSPSYWVPTTPAISPNLLKRTSSVLHCVRLLPVLNPSKYFLRLTAVLVSRLMLNLQETALRQGATKSEYESMLNWSSGPRSPSSLRFDRVVGCFGSSVCLSAHENDMRVEGEPAHEPA